MKSTKMIKRYLVVLLLTFVFVACHSDEMQSFRGCGFIISLPIAKIIEKIDNAVDVIEYVVYNEDRRLLFSISALNAPSTLNYFDLYEKELSKEYKRLGSFVDLYNEMGLGENMETIIYGSNMNDFPIYVRILYSLDVISSEEISKILETLSIEKDSASSIYCR